MGGIDDAIVKHYKQLAFVNGKRYKADHETWRETNKWLTFISVIINTSDTYVNIYFYSICIMMMRVKASTSNTSLVPMWIMLHLTIHLAIPN